MTPKNKDMLYTIVVNSYSGNPCEAWTYASREKAVEVVERTMESMGVKYEWDDEDEKNYATEQDGTTWSILESEDDTKHPDLAELADLLKEVAKRGADGELSAEEARDTYREGLENIASALDLLDEFLSAEEEN